MLIDFIPADRLPWVIVWLDWHFHAHWQSLTVVFLLLLLEDRTNWFLIPIKTILIWASYCLLRYGVAVG